MLCYRFSMLLLSAQSELLQLNLLRLQRSHSAYLCQGSSSDRPQLAVIDIRLLGLTSKADGQFLRFHPEEAKLSD